MTALYLAYFAKRSREILQYRWECNFIMSICRMIFFFPCEANLVPPTKKSNQKKQKQAFWPYKAGRKKISWQESIKSVCTADRRCSDYITNQTSSFTFDMPISTFLFSFDFLCWYSVLLNIRFNERQLNSQTSQVLWILNKKSHSEEPHTYTRNAPKACLLLLLPFQFEFSALVV